MSKQRQVRIFVSYAHEDKVWRDALFKNIIYTPFGMRSAWTDDNIHSGSLWEDEIKQALEQATVAILLVSKHFLQSVYISREELPTILNKRISEGLKLLWIPIGNVGEIKNEELVALQAIHSLKKRLTIYPNVDPDISKKVVESVRFEIQMAIDPIGVPLMRDLKENYESFTLIDQTHMSTLYRSRDRTLQRPVAIKVLADVDRIDDFIKSVRDAAIIANEPNFVKIYEAVLTERRPYCVFQYIEGQNLREWIETDSRRPIAVIIRIISKITKALISAHTLGNGYGNLRPSNVILDKNNEPFILPMGRRIDDCRNPKVIDQLEKRLPNREEIAYLTPEQFDFEIETVSGELSDQYMLGLLAFELMTGILPPTTGNYVSISESLENIRVHGGKAFIDLPPVSSLRSDCSEFMDIVIQRMTRRQPNERYASLKELLNVVRRQEDVILARVRESYARCIKEQEVNKRSFFEAVYKLFFERRNDAEDLFKNLGQRQYEILENALVGLISFYEQERASTPSEPNVLTQVAQQHSRHKHRIALDFYEPFTESIIDVVCGVPSSTTFIFDPKCRGDELNQSRLRSAWRDVLRPGVEYMKNKY